MTFLRKRIAVVGGGVAGLVTAWLLDPVHDVVLFERNARLGGHAHTVDGGYDLAAQFVSPAVQPTYWRLANEVLAIKMERIRNTAALTDPRRLLDSAQPHRTPLGAAALGAMMAAGRTNRTWDMTVSEFVSRRLRWLPAATRNDVVLPWIAAFGNCVIPVALETSAMAALAFMQRAATLTSMTYYNAVDGLGVIADRLAISDVRTSTEITRISRSPEGFHLRGEVFDVLVLAVPASVARKLLTGVLDRDLSGFREIRATMAIHTDPIYMPARRRDWRAFNAVRTGEHCEASIWYGGLRGTTEQVFKSWTTFRDRQPTEVIAAAEYWHPVITPDTVRAQQRLEAIQGRDDLWFAGSWTFDVDSQESAVVSAAKIAQRLGGRTF
ncbi:FAD-dependent oxidoreductase [Mycobacterium sp. 3519A]|uniref:FAD-dependent oxidoreductase n=1 Tax=Mycobacterium sp. 3519A TaxID=2057184 RepID=UPI000C7AC042|nr:FAD-dependent oxidoreductase [Mycobacterium sp. 3519A]